MKRYQLYDWARNKRIGKQVILTPNIVAILNYALALNNTTKKYKLVN